MKKILLILIATVAPVTSHALVADRFNCTMEIKAMGSKASAKQEKDFFVARLPLSESPSPDVRLTAGQTMDYLTLNTDKGEFSASLNFYFKHAVKLDANGVPTEARQLTCAGLYGSYCEWSTGDEPTVCSTGAVACFDSNPPFDPSNGWSETSLSGGVPAFNEKMLAPVSQDIKDDKGNKVGLLSLSCQYKGSFQ